MNLLLSSIAVYLVTLAGIAHADNPSALARELEQMLDADQMIRREIREEEAAPGPDSKKIEALWEKQNALDAANIVRLKEIVDATGWPRISIVGEKAALAAFLVVQHADPSHQKALIELLRVEARRGEVKLSSLALLEDRILTSEGKPQIYGSQLRRSPETNKLEFFPIEAPESVNARRASVGLESIEEYARRFGFEYAPGKDA